jgi:hypothetical protein
LQPAHAPLSESVSVHVEENEGSREIVEGHKPQQEQGAGHKLKEEQGHTPQQEQNQDQDHEFELVVASTKKEDTSWLHTYLPSWHKNIYVADDAGAALTVPKNKGREAMVYLTYMIDRYDSLPRSVLFLHASRFAWHNDDPDYDALPTLRNFQLPYLRRQGYVNLRCVWVIGCPSEIRPAHDEIHRDDAKLMAKNVYKKSFEELLPEVPVPDLVAVSCCSQFGVTRETIRSRPKADYIRYREWLLATPLDDALNGRVFEFAWHSKFDLLKIFLCSSENEHVISDQDRFVFSHFRQRSRALSLSGGLLLQCVWFLRHELQGRFLHGALYSSALLHPPERLAACWLAGGREKLYWPALE